MARIAGVNLPSQKHICIGLTAIFGIGRRSAMNICRKTEVNPATKVLDLTDAELGTLRDEVASHPIEGDLRREISMNIKRLMELGSYRGIRHRRGLPCRGQRTKTNAKTRKRRGKKK